ncbi:MAG TPA: M23 family peptidase, partial [Brevundimonas sp.]|nr:M23 family peptidase [Brevundimonas sp.]
MTLPRRQMMLGGGALTILMRGPAPGLAPAQIQGLPMTGRFVQGGYAFGRTWPLATVSVDGEALTTASADGLFVVGFDRDAPATVRLDARQGSQSAGQVLTIERGDFPTSRIDGLPPATVTPDDPELLARIRREATVKAAGFASRAESEHFRDGFDWPLENFRISSAWGSQRVLNGTPARPHYGVDLAAPQGTPIRAPAAGVVTLAQPDMH